MLSEGKDFEAILSYRHAFQAGVRDPAMLRNMSLAYYNLRLLEQAIDSMEMAIGLSSADPEVLTELGILYAAGGELEKANAALQKSLQQDPGQGDAYFYLGMVLLRQGDIKLAWQAARVSQQLHQDPVLLVERLRVQEVPEPQDYSFQDDHSKIGLRQIVLENRQQGAELVARWQRGDSLAEFFLDYSEGTAQKLPGYSGTFSKVEIKPEILSAISGSENYGAPVIVAVEGSYLLVQKIRPFNPVDWGSMQTGGRAAISSRESDQSEALLEDSIAEEGKIGSSEKEFYARKSIDHSKVQLYAGSYHLKKYAIEQILNLQGINFPAFYITDRDSDGRSLYHVIAGEYSSKAEALLEQKQLREKGINSFFPEH